MHRDIRTILSGFDGLAEINGLDRKDLRASQMRRSAASIPANIAEGQARRSRGEFVHLLGVARGSLAELETFLTLSTKLALTTPEKGRRLLNDCAEIGKMLNALIKSLNTND